ncbi:MAG: universal stress protein [Bacteroidetes bacterium]|nr:universal stress protein [Bacteroidota bacterium]
MKKRFIVLIDFSEYSANLLKYAFDWGKRIDAELLLVHKLEFVTSGRIDDLKREETTQIAISESFGELKDFAHSVLPEAAHQFKFTVALNNLTAKLSELLKEPYDNLMFVGVKETGLLEKLFLGNIAIEVIDDTTGIVAAIPEDMKIFAPEKIFIGVKEVFPLNVSELTTLLDYFGNAVPAINFFTILNPEDDTLKSENYLNELSRQFSAKAITSTSVYKTENVDNYIKDMMRNNPNALLVVQKGSRLLKDNLLRHFLINELIYDGKSPLIILP